MRSFHEYDPIAVALYFLAVTGVAMFFSHPAVTALTLLGALTYFFMRNGARDMKSHASLLLLFIVLAAVNPLISHNGRTVLFVLNDSPITLEALLYGVNSAGMILGIIYWFRSFTQIMTSDKILCVFGRLSPKLSLVLSIALRFIPLFRSQAKKVSDAQRAMGMYSDDNIVDNIRGGSRVFSIMVTWALENGIITADSMEARGYGTCRRTSFSPHRMNSGDRLLIAVSAALSAVNIAGIAAKKLEFNFYPDIRISTGGVIGAAALAAYGVLAFIPVIIEVEAGIKWKYLKSKI